MISPLGEASVQEQVQALSKFVDAIIEFAVKYGFQFLGALVFFIIGIKLAGWCANKIKVLLERKELDPMLVKFVGGVIKMLVIAVIIIITLGNFGISIAPQIAVASVTVRHSTIRCGGSPCGHCVDSGLMSPPSRSRTAPTSHPHG